MPTYSGTTPRLFALSTASPNTSVHVVSINAPASSVDADLALVPKGAGALSADVADSGYGGNKRGAFATDWMHTGNGVRSSGSQVAAGGYATLGGGGYNQAGTTAHTDVSIPGGYSHTVTANTGTIGGGYYNQITGAGATARGGERRRCCLGTRGMLRAGGRRRPCALCRFARSRLSPHRQEKKIRHAP